jgi:hypothetical protein
MMWTSLRSKEFNDCRVITRDSGEHGALPSFVGAGGDTSSLISLSRANKNSVLFVFSAVCSRSTPSPPLSLVRPMSMTMVATL